MRAVRCEGIVSRLISILCLLHTDPSPPRDLTVTTVFQHGIELNWIPPRETNGDIQHYIIYTTQNGIDCEQEINTTDNTNYYNLTGLEIGRTYNITVVAVNSAGMSERSGTIYTHRTMETTVVSGEKKNILGYAKLACVRDSNLFTRSHTFRLIQLVSLP